MLLALLMDEFLSKRSHESIKAVIQVGSFTVQIPRMDEMPPMQQQLAPQKVRHREAAMKKADSHPSTGQ